MKYTVDRFESGFVVCETENLEIVSLPLDSLPEGVREGSVIMLDGGKYTLLDCEEEERRNRILSLQDELFSL